MVYSDVFGWPRGPALPAPHRFFLMVLQSCRPGPALFSHQCLVVLWSSAPVTNRFHIMVGWSRPRTDFALQCCGPAVPVPDRFCIRVSHHNFASWFRGPAGPRSRGPALIRIAVPQSQSRSHNDFASRSHGLGPYVYVKKHTNRVLPSLFNMQDDMFGVDAGMIYEIVRRKSEWHVNG
jgi:hypothetical protein